MRQFLFLVLAVVSLAVSSPAARAASDDLSALIEAMRIEETVQILREEGIRYGTELGAEMIPDVSDRVWQAVVTRIYDTEKMAQVVRRGFEDALEDAEFLEALAFYTSDVGREIVALELSAREAFLQEDTEEAAMAAFEQERDGDTVLFQQVETLIEDSDLVEFNVMGALNSNLMFYRGLSDGGAIERSEADMLAEVWAQEGEIRESSSGWLGAFMLLAYQPLDDDALEAYVEFYRSDQGQVLNAAIFETYDQLYEELSYLLGRAIAQQMQAEDL